MDDLLDDPQPISEEPTVDLSEAEQPDLIDIPKDWEDHWQGMPAYDHENLQPKQSILVHFKDQKDRRAFAELVQQTINPDTKFIWYPKMERRVMINKRWQSSTEDKSSPRYPVYVPTKGRWETPQTIRALEEINVPYFAVVQPQEVEHYRKVVKQGEILILPAGLDGLVPTRNWIRQHSMDAGAKRHWQIDDNIQWFARFHKNIKHRVTDGAVFRLMEDWTDRYTNIAVSGPNYDMFTPMKTVVPPITVNTRVYSCSLVNNEQPHWWRDVYNDDTDLCLRALKDGWCVVQFNAYVGKKTTTMYLKGGNTGIYLGAEKVFEDWKQHVASCEICEEEVSPVNCEVGREILSQDGRWKMAESLRRQHPDVTTVQRKWDRWQHQVDYRPFRENQLILRPDFVAPENGDDVFELIHVEQTEEPVEEKPTRTPRPKVEKPQVDPPAGLNVFEFLTQAQEPQSAPQPEPQSASETVQGAKPEPHLTQGLEPASSQPEPASGLSSDPQPEPEKPSVLALFLGPAPVVTPSRNAYADWRPQEPPSLAGITDIVLNFETDGTDWAAGHRPVGVTVGTLDGTMKRFLPFKFAGGNLEEETVKRWFDREVRGKHITNANTRFEVHMAREWGLDLEERGNTVSDVMHWAALLDDHRKRFALDVLVEDFLHDVIPPSRVDESRIATFHACDVAERAEFQVEAIARLRDEMWPLLEAEDLQRVRHLEDQVIYPVCEMEKNGSLIDMEMLEQMSAECQSAYGKLMMEISGELGFAFAHTAKGWARTFEKLGLPPSDSYDEEVITSIDHPLVMKGHLASQYASLNSKTFAAYKKMIGEDGILRYDINQLRGDDGGTVSGRFSIGYVQQVPNHDNHHRAFGDIAELESCLGLCPLFPRRLYKSLTGEYLEADASQIEYRLFAHHANNAEVLAAYAKDPTMSFHKTTWNMMKVHKPDMLYSHQKNFNFAKMYGARSIKLATMMKMITEEIGEEIRKAKRWTDPRLAQIQAIEAAYKKMMPEGDQLLERAAHLAKPECDEYCRKNDALHKMYPHRGFVKTLLGRKSRFLNNWKTYIGLNRVIQGTGADIMKQKIVELHRERKTTGLLMRLTIHDQIAGDCQTHATKGLVDQILNTQSFPELKVPILWSVKNGPNWAECR